MMRGYEPGLSKGGGAQSDMRQGIARFTRSYHYSRELPI